MIIDKLRSFQVESTNALDLLDKITDSRCLVYADPPYLMGSRSSGKRYRHETDDEFHIKLAEKVQTKDFLWIVSGYEHPLYDELYKGFNKVVGPQSNGTVSKKGIKECLYMNYNIDQVRGQLSFIK